MADWIAVIKEAQKRDIKFPATSAIMYSMLEELEGLESYRALGTVEELAELVAAKQDNRLAIFPKVKYFERKDFLDLMRDVRDDMTQEDRSVGIFASPDGELALMQTIINALEEQTNGTP